MKSYTIKSIEELNVLGRKINNFLKAVVTSHEKSQNYVTEPHEEYITQKMDPDT
jgi:hypothetical protein